MSRRRSRQGRRNSAQDRERFRASSGYTYSVRDLDRETAARVWSDAMDAADKPTTRAAGRILRDNRRTERGR